MEKNSEEELSNAIYSSAVGKMAKLTFLGGTTNCVGLYEMSIGAYVTSKDRLLHH
jgi:hypothetical protein